GPGAIDTDDEGTPARAVTLLDRGRLAGLLHDRHTAHAMRTAPTGNGRRQDFRFRAEPRMRNLVVGPGEHDPRAIFSGIARGLWLERIGFARVDAARGVFVLGVDRGRRIVRGRIGAPVRGLWISGRVVDALASTEAVAHDFAVGEEPIYCVKRGLVYSGVA